MRLPRPVALWLLVIVAGAAMGRTPAAAAPDGAAIFTSPAAPVVGGPLRAMAVADRPLDVALTVLDPRGVLVARARQHHGGPPYWWEVEAIADRPGAYRVCLGGTMACADARVGATATRPPPADGAWPISRQWNRAAESLYAAWIEKLFDDPLTAEPSWHALHEVTRRRERNFLHDHRGLGEDDERGLRLEPDCADLPYVLRAYFAWKLELPFGWSECSRGDGGRPPRCARWSPAPALPAGGDELAAVQRFFLRLEDAVQSGNGRVPATSDGGDFYPTRLDVDGLRPGTVYADPYGHTLLLVQRLPQTPSRPGILLAVDAQPDKTVARKRYWRGNFLFAIDPALGSAGFKRFRPVVGERGALRPLANREIAAAPDYGDYALAQYEAGVEGFYDRVDAVLSPQPLDPQRVFRETIEALEEQVRTRLRSVDNGAEYTAAHPGVIAMPEGAAIFETSGAWEDYATPSRDLRLLIALDVVRAFPARVAAQPQRFAMPAGRPPAAVQADLEAMLRAELAARHIAYTRSDGSSWTLTLADILARAEALEMAYNPNDCIEARWGAAPGSPEMATCRRRAPAEQAARMARCRAWFHERRRPPR